MKHSLSNSANYLRQGQSIVDALFDELEKGRKADPQTVSDQCSRFTQWLDSNNEICMTGIKQTVIKDASFLHYRWVSASGMSTEDTSVNNMKKPSKKSIAIAQSLASAIPIMKKEGLHNYLTFPADVMCSAVKNFVAFGDISLIANCTQSHVHYYETFARLGVHNQQAALIEFASSIEIFIGDSDPLEKQMKLGVAMTGYLHGLDRSDARVINEHTLSPETKSFFSEMLPYVEMLAIHRVPNTTPRLGSGINAMMLGLNKWGESILHNEWVIACEKGTDYLVDIYRCGSISIKQHLKKEQEAYDLLMNSKNPIGNPEINDIRYLISYAIKANDPNFTINDLHLNKDNYRVIYNTAMNLALFKTHDNVEHLVANVNHERLVELIVSAGSFGEIDKERVIALQELRPHLINANFFKRDILALDLGM